MKKIQLQFFFIELARSSPFRVYDFSYNISENRDHTNVGAAASATGRVEVEIDCGYFQFGIWRDAGTDFTTEFFSVDCHVDFDFK